MRGPLELMLWETRDGHWSARARFSVESEETEVRTDACSERGFALHDLMWFVDRAFNRESKTGSEEQ